MENKNNNNIKVNGTIFIPLDINIDKHLDKPVEKLLTEAKAGNPESQFILGHRYMKGDFNQKTPEQGLYWLNQAANNDHMLAQWELGMIYKYGHGAPVNIPKAISFFTKAATQGLAEAQSTLGSLYFVGDGVPVDIKKAKKWLLRSASQGRAEAMHNLGNIYITDEFGQLNLRKSIKWYTKAAMLGLTEAQFCLGNIYHHGGEDVEIDIIKALKWYTKAAEADDTLSQYALGTIFDQGSEEIKPDKLKAFKWFTKAAEKGHANAQYNLGNLYSTVRSIADPEQAAKWFNEAAANGDTEAQYLMSTFYSFGLVDGVDIDKDKAIEMHNLAAEKGFPPSQIVLGFIHNLGYGVPVNKTLGRHYFDLAEENGLNVSEFLQESMDDDSIISVFVLKMFHMAGEKGLFEAQFALAKYYYQPFKKNFDIDQAIYWYTKTADQGDPQAQYKLGEIYSANKHVPMDMKKAINFYTMAAEQGLLAAQLEISRLYCSEDYEIDAVVAYKCLRELARKGNKLSQFYLGMWYIRNSENEPSNRDKAKRWLIISASNGLPQAAEYLKSNFDYSVES
jgi:TPR repeat protein